MRLINAEYGIELELEENIVNVLVIEEPHILADIINGLYQQCLGQDGHFVLSQLEKLCKIEKEMVCVLEPFTIDVGEKRIITKLYQELNLQVSENMIEEMVNINAALINYLDKAVEQLPYSISFNYQMDNIGIFKVFNLSLDYNTGSLLERIIDYLRAMSQLCGYRIVVFLNLKSFLAVHELLELYEFVFYNKIYIILIENNQYAKENAEKVCIIDKDKCIICL